MYQAHIFGEAMEIKYRAEVSVIFIFADKKYSQTDPNYYKILLDCQNNVYNMTRKQIDNEKQIKNMHEKIDTIIGLIEDDKKEHEKINK